jgi:hypothetical protein
MGGCGTMRGLDNTTKRPIKLRLPPELIRAIRIRAAELDTSMSAVVEVWARTGLVEDPGGGRELPIDWEGTAARHGERIVNLETALHAAVGLLGGAVEEGTGWTCDGCVAHKDLDYHRGDGCRFEQWCGGATGEKP